MLAAAAAADCGYSTASAALEEHGSSIHARIASARGRIGAPAAASSNKINSAKIPRFASFRNPRSPRRSGLRLRCSPLDVNVVTTRPKPVDLGGTGGHGKNGGGGGNGGDGGSQGDGNDDHEEIPKADESFGSLLNAEEVERQVKARGAVLPPDMAEAARTVGIPEIILSRFLDLQAAPWPLGPAIRGSSLLRNRMLADPSFLFKVLTEVAIDSGCATFAEVNKRGKDFWGEFELYMSDLLVGIVMDVALVGMLAPVVQFGGSTSGRSAMSRTLKALPSSIFEAERPGRRFSVQQRLGTFFYKAIQYGAVGFVCGLIGQGFASSIMVAKRRFSKSVHDEVPVPPLLKSAALWAVFMGVSSNTRYQVINGLEQLVEGTPMAKSFPLIAMAFTVGVRFANNIYGGMQFVDWARLSGVQ